MLLYSRKKITIKHIRAGDLVRIYKRTPSVYFSSRFTFINVIIIPLVYRAFRIAADLAESFSLILYARKRARLQATADAKD